MQPQMTSHDSLSRCGLEEDDLILLRRVAAQDRQAFETLYTRYAPRLTAYLRRRLAPADQVEDVLHETMLAVWHQAPAYQPTGRVSAWMFGIAHRQALKACAMAARQAQAPYAPRPEAEAEASPEADLLRQEGERMVAAALATLRPEQQAVVELTYYQHYGYPEIAAILECPVNTVKTRMLKARRHLEAYFVRLGLVPAHGKPTRQTGRVASRVPQPTAPVPDVGGLTVATLGKEVATSAALLQAVTGAGGQHEDDTAAFFAEPLVGGAV